MNDDKVYVGLILVNVKSIQVDLKKQLCGQEKKGNDAKVGERHTLIVVSDTKSWKFPSRQGFPIKL